MRGYEFRELVYHDGDRDLLIDFENDEKEILASFIDQVPQFPDFIIPFLDNVLSGKSEFEEFNINGVYDVDVWPEKTRIENLCPYDEDDEEAYCWVETHELRELIDMWLAKLEEYKRTGKY